MGIGAILAGLLGVAGTLLGKKITTAVVGVDSAIVSAIKPVQPVVALGLSLVLPKACAAIGLLAASCPTGDALTGAPIGVIGGIALLEVGKRIGLVR